MENQMQTLVEAKARWKRVGEEVFGRIGMSSQELNALRCSYHAISRRKRSGEIRLLHVPDPELKDVQHKLLRNVFRQLPVHRAAKGFVRNRSIVHHAYSHIGKRYVLTCDIADFFPSTKADRIHNFFTEEMGWSHFITEQIVRLVCLPRKQCLPQGAPTSPIIANIVNRRMDARLAAFARKHHLDYSRYADDLAFSPIHHDGADAHPRFVLSVVGQILADCDYALRPDKCRIQRPHTRQLVTGLVVNTKCGLPRDVRRRLRAAVHRHRYNRRLSSPTTAGEEEGMSPEALHSWIAYRKMVLTQHRRQHAYKLIQESQVPKQEDAVKQEGASGTGSMPQPPT
jgi:RNA-directed DNA polymerase